MVYLLMSSPWNSTALLLLLLLLQSTAALFTPTQVRGTKASVFILPSGAGAGATNWSGKIKGQSFWTNETLLAVWDQNHVADATMLKHSLGSDVEATAIIYFQGYLADVGVWGPMPVKRLADAVAAYKLVGIKSILFLGDPEFYGRGTWEQTHDIVRNATARAYFLGCVKKILAEPKLSFAFVSSYWLGASSRCVTCTEVQIASLISDIQRVTNAANVTYLQHVDGPFWDANSDGVNGYSAKSLAAAQGVMGESWTQGDLRASVAAFLTAGGATTSTLLLLNDVPNCDDASQPKRCSTGSVENDTAAWFADLDALGVGNTWGVWDFCDGGIGDFNSYGDVTNDGTALTRKGTLHRARALQEQRAQQIVITVPAVALPPCTHATKQRALYLDYDYGDVPLSASPATSISVDHHWTNVSALHSFGKNGVFAAQPIEITGGGGADIIGGYFGTQVDGDPSKGGFLFSIWDALRKETGGKNCTTPGGGGGGGGGVAAPNRTWCEHRHAIPLLSTRCRRHCLDCGLHPGWHNTTGVQCSVPWTFEEGGSPVRLVLERESTNVTVENPLGLGQKYTGDVWRLSAVIETAGGGKNVQVVEVGRMLLEDVVDSGVTRYGAFHEHIGCVPCSSFYESEERRGPYAIQPGNRTVRGIGFQRKTDLACQLYDVVVGGGGGGEVPSAVIETGPGTGQK